MKTFNIILKSCKQLYPALYSLPNKDLFCWCLRNEIKDYNDRNINEYLIHKI